MALIWTAKSEILGIWIGTWLNKSGTHWCSPSFLLFWIRRTIITLVTFVYVSSDTYNGQWLPFFPLTASFPIQIDYREVLLHCVAPSSSLFRLLSNVVHFRTPWHIYQLTCTIGALWVLMVSTTMSLRRYIFARRRPYDPYVLF